MIILKESPDFVLYGSRTKIKDLINRAVSNFTKANVIPTLNQVENFVTADRWAKVNISDSKIGFAKDGFEFITLDDLCKNIQNLCAFNLNDLDESIKEDVDGELFYTSEIDAIYNELKRNFDKRELEVKKVYKPKYAVRVTTMKELPNNHEYVEDFYIFLGTDDNRITMVSEDRKMLKFIDVEAVIDFFYEYLNA